MYVYVYRDVASYACRQHMRRHENGGALAPGRCNLLRNIWNDKILRECFN